MTSHKIIEPGQSWKIDIFRPQDAQGVCDLFLAVYGNGYPIRKFVEPNMLIEENRTGRTISSVARTTKGDIVGHNAIFHSAPSNSIFESGAGLVHRDYRGGKGIFADMVRHGVEIAAHTIKAAAVFGEPICNHPYSQKMCRSQGWITHALEVDLMPAETYAHEQSASGRVSAFLAFKTLHPRPHTVFLPRVYDKPLRDIYKGLDDQRQQTVSTDELPGDVTTRVAAEVFDFARVARLTVNEAGGDFAQALDAVEKDVRQKDVKVIQVWLKLTWPWVGQAANILRSKRYFLGGVLPRWFDDDGLLMQKIIGRPDWESINIQFDRARNIFDIVRHDWESISDT